MKIAQLMTKDPKVCRQTDYLDVAVGLMWQHDLGAVPIIDDEGQLVGIVTDRDACMASYLQGQPLQVIPCAVAMSTHVISCRPQDTDLGVANLMAKNKIRRIPVIDDAQHPIGMVSLNDLALATARGRDVPATTLAGTLAAICEHRPNPSSAAG
jgi:CBS domain-containing protein